MHLVYLACRSTVPSSTNRRVDAFEHDQMMDCLRRAFEPHGGKVSDVAWDDQTVDWSTFDAALIGTAWDYPDNLPAFLAALDMIGAKIPVFNSRALVQWNTDKGYLRDLGDKGVRLIPTIWLDKVIPRAFGEVFDAFGVDTIIAKRQVGAGADGQHKIIRGDAVPEMPHAMMIQPFMPSIVAEGEISFIFIGGEFCHALLKTAAAGDYRIQSCYGGKETPLTPSADDIAAASEVLGACDETPLYARVDMVRADDGGLVLMEIELVEPFLYPLQGPELGPRLYQAIKARL
ncbi:ATP-grasp domain-containing protein [Kordiimonas sp.]|uniref:ATP-grasp domain-containing protein n=1 Tax=Kordiimonas sp. TaxID=1970157 RepID=UPI003A91BE19